MKAVYLDNNATTRVDPAAVAAMLPFFTEQFGNASSMHAFGSDVGAALRKGRQQLQALLGAAFDHEIVFTGGGTESDNTAILSALETQGGRNEIVTTAVEHPAVLALCAWLEKSRGVKVHYIGVDARGRLDIEAYRHALSPRTAIASVMWANNETGTLFPVAMLAELAHEAGALFHTDAVQAVGKIPMNLKDTAIDMLSLSGHKFHGPKGIGALYVRRGVRLRPLIRGGHQERGRRAGTENAPGIIGLGVAAELANEHIEEENTRVRALRDRLEQGLLQRIGNAFVAGDTENRLPNTANVAFEFIEGEAILLLLNKAGIAASSGSACTSGSLEPSHVLRAMNVPYTAAHGAIRFSFSRENTDADVDHVLEVMPGIIARLREMSPFWDGRNAVQSGFAPTYA
ncbi:cysteine desulfurase NifS [Komagataeibacter swingsii]|uniref:Cysteine desulfurase n=1 Tax=Komagataeibacter swingsii TaxID=215220 RepID=A0A850P0K3_9PROT|nr:cysteine desulfurase NifS [Komagataeibacter swingsii]NVN38205.1 cysteine desulfurase NifS [Komagataeibacter swingsii]